MRQSAEVRWVGLSNFWIEIEESFQAGLQLPFDIFFAAFENVHGNPRLAPILQLQRRVFDFGHFLRGQQPQPINQGQICHVWILNAEFAQNYQVVLDALITLRPAKPSC
jgi:hypothetical protein